MWSDFWQLNSRLESEISISFKILKVNLNLLLDLNSHLSLFICSIILTWIISSPILSDFIFSPVLDFKLLNKYFPHGTLCHLKHFLSSLFYTISPSVCLLLNWLCWRNTKVRNFGSCFQLYYQFSTQLLRWCQDLRSLDCLYNRGISLLF